MRDSQGMITQHGCKKLTSNSKITDSTEPIGEVTHETEGFTAHFAATVHLLFVENQPRAAHQVTASLPNGYRNLAGIVYRGAEHTARIKGQMDVPLCIEGYQTTATANGLQLLMDDLIGGLLHS